MDISKALILFTTHLESDSVVEIPRGVGGGRGEYYSQLTIREYANLKGYGFRSIPWFGKEYESVNPKRFLASSPVISSARLVGTVSGAVTFVLIQVRHLEKEG